MRAGSSIRYCASADVIVECAPAAVVGTIIEEIIEADSARFTMTIENIPTIENPKTGKITALSLIATLKRFTEPMIAGT